jgi:hypothetical protein
MGIKQVGMINEKFYLVKLLPGFICICTLQRSPFTSVFLAFSWPVVIIPSGLWQARSQRTDAGVTWTSVSPESPEVGCDDSARSVTFLAVRRISPVLHILW